MLNQLDPRLRTALENDSAAQTLLNELHRQILGRPHAGVLAQLLGKYVATAASRTSGAAPGTRATASVLTVSNLSKAAHDAAQAIIQNMRA